MNSYWRGMSIFFGILMAPVAIVVCGKWGFEIGMFGLSVLVSVLLLAVGAKIIGSGRSVFRTIIGIPFVLLGLWQFVLIPYALVNEFLL